MLNAQSAEALTTISGTFADAIFSPNGAQLYALSGNTISVIDVASGATVASYTVGTKLGGLSVSVDGTTLAAVEETTGTGPGTLYTIDLADGSVATVHPAGTTTLYDAAFLADGTIVVSQQTSAPLLAVDLSDGSTHAVTPTIDPKATIEISADGTYVVGAGHYPAAPIETYDLETGGGFSARGIFDPYAGAALPGPEAGVGAVSPDGSLIVQDTLIVYDTATQTSFSLADSYAYLANPAGFAFSPDGSSLYLLTNDGHIVQFDTKTWDVTASYWSAAHPVSPVGYSTDTLFGYGDILQASSDGTHLSVIGPKGINIIDLSLSRTLSGPGADNLQGAAQYGFDGNDVLHGSGTSFMAGGKDDDTYYVAGSGDHIWELANQGLDTVHSAASTYILGSNLENLVLDGAADINGAGNELANQIAGNSGSNHLDGGAGDDAITGMGGNDVISGGSGNDTLTGSTGNDEIHGGDGDDAIDGGGGVDLLDGGAGNDVLTFGSNTDPFGGHDIGWGGSGSDTIVGSNGDDRLYSDQREDPNLGYSPFTIDFPAYYHAPTLDHGTEIDTINAGDGDDFVSIGYGDSADGGGQGEQGDTLFLSLAASPTGVTVDFRSAMLSIGGGTITGFENVNYVEGSQFNDVFTFSADPFPVAGFGGPSGGGTEISAIGGDDRVTAGYYTQNIWGGDGNDVLDGRASQYLQYIDGGTGNDTIYSSRNGATLSGGDGTDTVNGGAGMDFISGGNGDDALNGGGADDIIHGDAGNDTINGGAGADSVFGVAGDDHYVVDNVGDTVTETAGLGSGIDTVQSSVSFTLGANVENLELTGTTAINGTGNGLDNIIAGNGQGNQLDGGTATTR